VTSVSPCQPGARVSFGCASGVEGTGVLVKRVWRKEVGETVGAIAHLEVPLPLEALSELCVLREERRDPKRVLLWGAAH